MSESLSLGDGVGRAAVIGAVIGFATVICVATLMGLLGGLPPPGALAVGAFAAVWGGPGFGAMFGAIAAITRNERVAAAALLSARVSGSAEGSSGGTADGS